MDPNQKSGLMASVMNYINELSQTQKIIAGTFIGMAVFVIIMVSWIMSKPKMAVLFSNLQTEDAAAITQKLEEAKIPYKLSADGSSIQVPAKDRAKLTMQMATEGLPQGGSVGWELFDKSSFGMTEFSEKMNYQRALQGELTRTIMQLSPIQSARVHLAIPENKVYLDEQEPSTAAVFLSLKKGRSLTDEQIGGIVHLVASAVEGLKPENVRVVSSDGTELTDASLDSTAGGMLTTKQAKLKKQYESEVASKVQTMLGKILGNEKAVVRVNADLSFDKKQTMSESYQPGDGSERGIVLAQETKRESYSGKVLPPGGVAANPNRQSAGDDQYVREETVAQYQVTKKTEETVSAPGQVKRLSVAVLVDDKIPARQLPVIREAVTAAAGIDPERGDNIAVQRIPFDTSESKAQAAEMAAESKKELIFKIAKNVGAALLLIIFLLIMRSIAKQFKGGVEPQAQEAETSEEGSGETAQEPSNEDILKQAQQAMADVQQQGVDGKPVGVISGDLLPDEIAAASPEDLAKIVRSWLSEP